MSKSSGPEPEEEEPEPASEEKRLVLGAVGAAVPASRMPVGEEKGAGPVLVALGGLVVGWGPWVPGRVLKRKESGGGRLLYVGQRHTAVPSARSCGGRCSRTPRAW